MNFDLSGNWQKDCTIYIRGREEEVIINLPKEIGVVVNTKTSPGVKVLQGDLKKKGRGIWNKTFVNEFAEEDVVVLTVNIETTKGRIILTSD